MMSRTRSKSGISKQVKSDIMEKNKSKRCRILTKHEQVENVKVTLIRLKPKFNFKPQRKPDILTNIDSLRKKTTLDETIRIQLDELKKFEIFKDMNTDIKTVKLLISDAGEYDKRDKEILKLLEKGEKASDEEWLKLYEIENV